MLDYCDNYVKFKHRRSSCRESTRLSHSLTPLFPSSHFYLSASYCSCSHFFPSLSLQSSVCRQLRIMKGPTVIYNEQLDLPFCVRCKYAVAFDGVVRHMKRNHLISHSNSIQIAGEIREARGMSPNVIASADEMRHKYLATTVFEYRSGPALPPLDGFSTALYHKCPDCEYLAPKGASVRRNCAASKACKGQFFSSAR